MVIKIDRNIDNHVAKLSKIEAIVQQQTQSVNMIQDSIVQENKYLSCDIEQVIEHNRTVVIRSQLGTGKSEMISRLL